jgi:hypothetical protein
MFLGFQAEMKSANTNTVEFFEQCLIFRRQIHEIMDSSDA